VQEPVVIDPVALLRRYHAALGAYSAASVAPLFAPDARYLSPGVGALAGREAIIAAFDAYFSRYPDQLSVDDRVQALDARRVRSDWRLQARDATTGAHLMRRGSQTVIFDDAGLIVLVEVSDLPS